MYKKENLTFKHSMPVDIETFGFFHREYHYGREIQNRCMRDFLCYALEYYVPEQFGPNSLSPKIIEKKNLFGWKLPENFMWTGLHLKHVPLLLSSYGLKLFINKKPVRTWWACFSSLVNPSPLSADKAISMLEHYVDSGKPSAIDLTLKHYGVDDHVMFVFAYDDNNFYVFDTHYVDDIGYTKITEQNDRRLIMRLSKEKVKEKWTRRARVWVVEQV